MALISIRKTAAIEPSPTDTVSLYVDAADNHLKQIDENGNIIDLTDGSATSSPNAASLVNTTKAALVTLLGGGLANIKATYRITDAADGIIRVTAKTASLLTATAMKEGSDNGTGTVTDGEWGNYDLDADVFTSVIPYLSYVANLTQTGTDAPVATVMQNELGGTVVWTRIAAGEYVGTLTGAFTVYKTVCIVSGNISTGGFANIAPIDANIVNIFTSLINIDDLAVQTSDSILNLASVEIRVYP